LKRLTFGPITMLALFVATGTTPASHSAVGQSGGSTRMNPIVRENDKPGTTSWRLVHQAWPDQLKLSGYASAVSVDHGESVTLYVTDDTGSEALTLDVYRLGWYQGTGGRLIEEISGVAGETQPACTLDPLRYTVSCANWSPTYILSTLPSWVSGVYLIKITDARGFQTYIPLTVRDDASHSRLLAVDSVNTWQAYNWWGGYSLYGMYEAATGTIGGQRAYAVSFDRPYVGEGIGGQFPYYEFSEVSWLEKEGYDLTYTTDVDVDLRPRSLLQHRAVVVLGHSEYWSTAMRDGAARARREGTSLAFLGGNDAYWHVRYESGTLGSHRILVCYKSAQLDPELGHLNSQVTVLWRSPPLNRPEDKLLGEMWQGGTAYTPLRYVVADASGWEYAGTGATEGETSPGSPIEGDFDTYRPKRHLRTQVTVLGTSLPNSGDGRVADTTIYSAPSGALVFDAGNVTWGNGLSSAAGSADAWPVTERLTMNVLDQMLTQDRPAAIPPCSAAGHAAPCVFFRHITTPVWFSGSATDNEFTLDLGHKQRNDTLRWLSATGTVFGPAVTFPPSRPSPNYTIKLRWNAVSGLIRARGIKTNGRTVTFNAPSGAKGVKVTMPSGYTTRFKWGNGPWVLAPLLGGCCGPQIVRFSTV
jgi:hypothetical protein